MADRAAQRTLAILVNTISPYRLPIYAGVAARFRTFVFFCGTERNRGVVDAAEQVHRSVVVRRSAGLTIPYRLGRRQVYDERYLHLPFGQLRDLLRTRPDAVITTEMGARTILALLYGSLFRVPVWIWWGGTMHTERGIGRTRRLLRRLITRWGERWISYGRSSTAYLASLGVATERIVEIQNCVDESLFLNEAPRRGAGRSQPVLLYVGQMIRRKGVHHLLEAAAQVQRSGRSFTLRLVGGGPERAAFERQAAELGLENVEFLDARPPEEMPATYRAADYLVFPTCEDVWGLVVNEALWAGLPVLSSIHAGCAEEILPAGQTFDPEDTDVFARILAAAVDGEIGPATTAPLKRCAEVSAMISTAVERELAGSGR
jgi:glycosyltransferase involved in cell wall biosynthesis